MNESKNFVKSAVFSIVCSIIASSIYSWITSDANNFWTQFLDHIGKYLVTYIILVAVGTTVGGVVLNILVPKLRAMHKNSQMAKLAGLNCVFPRSMVEDKLPDDFPKNIISACENQDEISIMCSTGLSIFGGDETLIKNVLETAKKEVNVYLLNPSIDCRATKVRADSRGMERNQLRENIVKETLNNV